MLCVFMHSVVKAYAWLLPGKYSYCSGGAKPLPVVRPANFLENIAMVSGMHCVVFVVVTTQATTQDGGVKHRCK